MIKNRNPGRRSKRNRLRDGCEGDAMRGGDKREAGSVRDGRTGMSAKQELRSVSQSVPKGQCEAGASQNKVCSQAGDGGNEAGASETSAFPSWGRRERSRSFPDKCVPKLELGNEGKERRGYGAFGTMVNDPLSGGFRKKPAPSFCFCRMTPRTLTLSEVRGCMNSPVTRPVRALIFTRRRSAPAP